MKKINLNNPAVRYSIWKTYGGKCYYSGELIGYVDMTLDHLIPRNRTCIFNGKEFIQQQIILELGLSPDFDLNGLENILPCKASKNREKGIEVLPSILNDIKVAIKNKPRIENKILEFGKRENYEYSLAIVKSFTGKDRKLLEDTYNYLSEESSKFKNGKRVVLTGHLPSPESLQGNCAISLKSLDLRGLVITLSHFEILEYLTFALFTCPSEMRRKFISGPDSKNKDLYFIKLASTNFFLQKDELKELCDEIDIFITNYLHELQKAEEILGTLNFSISESFNNGYRLLKVSRGIWNTLLEFAYDFDIDNGSTEWHIFDKKNNFINVTSIKSCQRFNNGYHFSIYVENDNSFLGYPTKDVCIFWYPLKFEYCSNDNNKILFNERSTWNAEMIYLWLIKEFIPYSLWYYQFKSYKLSYFNIFLKSKENNYKKFLSTFKIEDYQITCLDQSFILKFDYSYNNLVVVINSLQQLFEDSINYYWLGDSEIKNLFKIAYISLLHSNEVENFNYHLSNFKLDKVTNIQGLINALEMTAMSSTCKKENYSIQLIFRSISSIYNFNKPNLNTQEVKEILDHLRPFILYYNQHSLIQKHLKN